MNVDIKEDGACRRNLEIEVGADKVDEVYQDLLDQYSRQASIPGFRKGKAPKAMVAKKYAKEVGEEAKKRIVSSAYQDVLKQEDVDVVAVLDMEEGDFDPSSEFRFKVTVDVAPEFKLPGYSGIKIKGESTEPSEEELEEGLKNVLEQFAKYEEIDDRPVQRDDMVKIDYLATVDGKPLEEVAPENEELAKKEDYWVLVNQNAFLPEMEEGLIGCNIGDEKDIEVVFPEDFADESLAGKKANYHVAVKTIRGKQLPEIDDELLGRLGVETEDDLREKLRVNMAESKTRSESQRRKDEICEYLLKKTKMEIPQSQVQGMMEDIIKDIVRRRTQMGAQREDIEEKRDEIFAEAKTTAEERVKLGYILDKIEKEENVEVSDSDIQEYLESGAQRYGMTPELFRENMLQHTDMENIEANLRTSKTLDMLLEKAEVKVK